VTRSLRSVVHRNGPRAPRAPRLLRATSTANKPRRRPPERSDGFATARQNGAEAPPTLGRTELVRSACPPTAGQEKSPSGALKFFRWRLSRTRRCEGRRLQRALYRAPAIPSLPTVVSPLQRPGQGSEPGRWKPWAGDKRRRSVHPTLAGPLPTGRGLGRVARLARACNETGFDPVLSLRRG
jgi:hypothetical protein